MRRIFGSTVIAMFAKKKPGDAVHVDWDAKGLSVTIVRMLRIADASTPRIAPT